MKFLALFLSVLMFAFSARAEKGGAHGGGGGGGVEIGSEVYLLDLYEAGFHKSEVLNIIVDREIAKELSVHGIDKDVAAILSAKIVEIERFDPVFADALLQAFKLLTWFKTPASLVSTEDLSEPLIKEKIIQLARRDGSVVRINSGYYNRMNIVNKAALFFHEALAALAPSYMPAKHLRSIVVIVFVSHTITMDIAEIRELLEAFPNVSKIKTVPSSDMFYTRSIFSTKVKSSRFYYAPTFLMTWADLRSATAKNIIVPNREPSGVVLAPAMAQSMQFLFCDTLRSHLSLTLIEVEAIALQISLPKVEVDGVQPRLRSNYNIEKQYSIYFDGQIARSKANCNENSRKELLAIYDWTSTLQPL